jgi:SpoVK/Ycf46/Vps4 family AAA+-type ATPase
MTGSLVGESQRKIRQAMEVFKAVSQGKGLFIATCNKIAALPPELKRRFTLGTFYVDLPSDEERSAIWPIWLKKYNLPKQAVA